MGVRLYNPTTGRFLTTDPEPGGSCNDYDYTCADPVNKEDLDG
jgi:RHS repeat-associated protein